MLIETDAALGKPSILVDATSILCWTSEMRVAPASLRLICILAEQCKNKYESSIKEGEHDGNKSTH